MSIQTLWLPPFAALMVVAAAASLEAQVESVGKVTLASGPHAGVYTVESPTPCEIKPARQDSPAEFGSNVATDEAIRERLSDKPKMLTWIRLRVPNLDPKHLGELRASVVFGDPRNRRTPGTAYEIDTTPLNGADSLFARDADRPLRKSSGRGGATLHRQGKTTTVAFWGETEKGVRFDGAIECRSNILE